MDNSCFKTEQTLKQLMAAVFSDETELFRSPSEPDAGDIVSVRLRLPKGFDGRAVLCCSGAPGMIMGPAGDDANFDYRSALLLCGNETAAYSFLIEWNGCTVVCDRIGARPAEDAGELHPFMIIPGFHVPEWSKGALQYQILVDRFCNACPDNDVKDNELYYNDGHAVHDDWDELPGTSDFRHFKGGDLQGVLQKLDYLQSLGVEAVYLNPIFISPSSHKYDTQDYFHIDPHLAVIAEDKDSAMEDWEKHNGYAARYIVRTLSPVNYEASDAYFAFLCSEMHSRGMKIILDGVFNHCSSFSNWMDREGVYLNKRGYEKGAWQSISSPYRSYFTFSSGRGGAFGEYEGWWGYTTLPKLNYEDAPELCEQIFSVAEKWASPPYSVDGWRLDVAADVGHTLQFNHTFWTEFRRRVKAVNPDLLIVAEHYGDPSDWLDGTQWDTVMNYDAFMEPVSWFFTGMEKHSDEFCPELLNNADAFFEAMAEKGALLGGPALMCAMNELSNHDHSRFLTRTNMTPGRLETSGSASAGENISTAVLREAVAVQMTWPGAPTVYYGDEAGQVGWTDPDDRRTYPWGHEDTELIAYHKALAEIRNENPVLREGSVIKLLSENGVIAYARFDSSACVVTVCNNLDEGKTLSIPVIPAGLHEGDIIHTLLRSDSEGFERVINETNSVSDGLLSIAVPPRSAVVLVSG